MPHYDDSTKPGNIPTDPEHTNYYSFLKALTRYPGVMTLQEACKFLKGILSHDVIANKNQLAELEEAYERLDDETHG